MTTQASLLKIADLLHTTAKQATGPAEAVSAMMLAAATIVVEHTPADKVQDTLLELTKQFGKFAITMLQLKQPPEPKVVPAPPVLKKPTPITIPAAKAPEEPVATPEEEKAFLASKEPEERTKGTKS